LKFNTGMNRLGFDWQDTARLWVLLKSHPNLKVTGLCSHLSHGHDVGLEKGQSRHQIERFEKICDEFSEVTDCFHFWNSSGLLAMSGREQTVLQQKGWGARPGISVYGGYTEMSIEDQVVRTFVEKLDLEPAMKLVAHVVQANWVRKGSVVSYGGTWKASRDSIIAVTSLGYGDGFPRHLSNRAVMGWQGMQLPVVGRVCMDYTMIDATGTVNSPDEIVGEDLVVYGSIKRDEPTAEAAATSIHTISYELFTGLSDRVPRVYERGLDLTGLKGGLLDVE
jgi:alanine racemase